MPFDNLINWPLVLQPFNWFIVIGVLFGFAFVLHIFLGGLNASV